MGFFLLLACTAYIAIRVGADGVFTTQLSLRENDVYLIELTP